MKFACKIRPSVKKMLTCSAKVFWVRSENVVNPFYNFPDEVNPAASGVKVLPR